MADPVTIAWAPPAARYSLRTRAPDGLPPILAEAPFAGGHALGLGPDEWLLILPDGAPPPTIRGLHALTDIGHRNSALTIDGAAAAKLIQEGCALDLSLAAFPVGKTTRTVYEDVEIVLWRTAETGGSGSRCGARSGNTFMRRSCWRRAISSQTVQAFANSALRRRSRQRSGQPVAPVAGARGP